MNPPELTRLPAAITPASSGASSAAAAARARPDAPLRDEVARQAPGELEHHHHRHHGAGARDDQPQVGLRLAEQREDRREDHRQRLPRRDRRSCGDRGGRSPGPTRATPTGRSSASRGSAATAPPITSAAAAEPQVEAPPARRPVSCAGPRRDIGRRRRRSQLCSGNGHGDRKMLVGAALASYARRAAARVQSLRTERGRCASILVGRADRPRPSGRGTRTGFMSCAPGSNRVGYPETPCWRQSSMLRQLAVRALVRVERARCRSPRRPAPFRRSDAACAAPGLFVNTTVGPAGGGTAPAARSGLIT